MEDIVCKNCYWEIDDCNTENCNRPKKMCGKDCKHFWAEESDYESGYIEDYGCNIMTYDDWDIQWGKYSDDATKCEKFEEGNREGPEQFLDD